MTASPDGAREQRLAQALRANLRRRKAADTGPSAPPTPAASRREALDGASGAERLHPEAPAEPSQADPSVERSS